ncbi:MAG: protocatechuate 3,4-dioxygenase, alpha subunit [Solirubrobacteraceae bacterium]|jgi:protocatechuate 3,4-dioxygenase alpha subunit|nr:protocatechuate 3,4-dioxygenase, alpha subunit [Solirubrobacteraceae bacterium]
MALVLTPSQTVGPYFPIGLTWDDGPFAVDEGTDGAIRLRGRVTDGAGDPVPDAMVESWQAGPDGRFAHPDDPRGAASAPGFRGFARAATSAGGEWEILTVKPGRVPGRGGAPQAPHIDLSVFARGLLNRVVTRVYFEDEPAANAGDRVLNGVPEDRRHTLVAQRTAGGYRFDIRLQGPDETVFFAV